MSEEKQGISRRDFLKGAAAGAVGIAAIGVLGGCSPKETAKKVNVSETTSSDIVVVGSGASGISAAVQAAELGAKVTLLESNPTLGGNGALTEGMFAVGSKMQKAAGINIAFRDVIFTEQEFFNYRPNALFWKDLVEASADNLDWLIGNGVRFSGVVDDYHGLGKIKAFHWFVDGKGTNFVGPMAAKAKALGVKIMMGTPAADLILNSGKVVGIYAKKADGSFIQINSKAVILASGGYANNKAMMEDRGYDMTYAINQGFPGHNGDGLRMATAAGGADVSKQRCFLRDPYSYGIDFFGPMTQAIHRGGPFLWVNENAERYANENCGAFTPGCNSNAVHTQRKSFLIFDHALLETLAKKVGTLVTDVESAVTKCPGKNIYKADSYEELAKKVGLAPDALVAAVTRYNTLCKQGLDEDFNKPADKMIALATPPYYIFRQDLSFWTSIGGIDTNRKMEVINKSGDAVPGLYAVGTDGCELYRETYTMNVPASCNGNNVNSGRTAAKNAVASLK